LGDYEQLSRDLEIENIKSKVQAIYKAFKKAVV